jgi:PAS domain S-box-containing protein
MGSPSQPNQIHASASKQLFEELFARSPDAILVINSDGTIVEASAQAESLFGYPRRELLGSPIEILLPERFREAHRNNRRQYASNPHIRPMGAGLSLYGLHNNGSEFPVDIMLSPVESPSTGCVIAVVRDITWRKHIEDELRQSAITPSSCSIWKDVLPPGIPGRRG